MIDQAACRYQLQVRDSGKRHERASARAQQKFANRLGRCRACNAHRDRHAAVGLAQLGNDGAVKCRVDGLQHLRCQLRLAGRHLKAYRAALGQALEHVSNIGRDGVVAIQIRTKHTNEE